MTLSIAVKDNEASKFRDAGINGTKIAVTNEDNAESLRFEQTSSTILYLATGLFGALDSEPKWHIQKIDTSSGVSIKNASEYKDKIWNDRAALTYV